MSNNNKDHNQKDKDRCSLSDTVICLSIGIAVGLLIGMMTMAYLVTYLADISKFYNCAKADEIFTNNTKNFDSQHYKQFNDLYCPIYKEMIK